QLAGGVAHDFNNLLTAILGHCDLLLMRRDASEEDFSDLAQIRQNANRAAALVRQMLAFSRKQTLRPEVLDLGTVLRDLSHLLDRLIWEKVRLEIDVPSDLWRIRADHRQLEQVIVNLVVNARDAMPEGGAIRLSASNESWREERRRDRAVMPAGDYVTIRVADEGVGIPPDRIAQIFEPFYTTKKVGEGTGLGLSTAYGIVKQTGGFIFAESPPGQGAVFSIHLPRYAGEALGIADGSERGLRGNDVPHGPPRVRSPEAIAGPAEARSGAADAPTLDEGASARGPVLALERPDRSGAAGDVGAPGGAPAETGAVLLVEDEAPVRSFAARALSLRGWTVIEADCAEAALSRLEDPELRIDVVVSDVVMPGLDGPSWVRMARRSRPDLAVVFVSGYAEDVFRRHVGDLGDLGDYTFLAKPYQLSDLAAAIDDVRAEAASQA
ncbi:MAG: ATP-binding protein, partial [Pseudomonadota bacterium]